jgi:hypothetical protein
MEKYTDAKYSKPGLAAPFVTINHDNYQIDVTQVTKLA